jgi:hypothetical protein
LFCVSARRSDNRFLLYFLRSSRLPTFLLSIGMEGRVLNASNSEPKKMLTTLRVDRRMACAYRLSVPRSTPWVRDLSGLTLFSACCARHFFAASARIRDFANSFVLGWPLSSTLSTNTNTKLGATPLAWEVHKLGSCKCAISYARGKVSHEVRKGQTGARAFPAFKFLQISTRLFRAPILAVYSAGNR